MHRDLFVQQHGPEYPQCIDLFVQQYGPEYPSYPNYNRFYTVLVCEVYWDTMRAERRHNYASLPL